MGLNDIKTASVEALLAEVERLDNMHFESEVAQCMKLMIRCKITDEIRRRKQMVA